MVNPRDFSHLERGLSILVEEHESIRESWRMFFAERNLRLLTFASENEFFAEFRQHGEPTEFFFDQDFGESRGVGLRLSRIVQNWPGRTGTCLVTDYDADDFKAEIAGGIVNAILPKFPEAIFGADYFDRHIERRFREQGHRAVLIESIAKVGAAFRGLSKLSSEEKSGVKP